MAEPRRMTRLKLLRLARRISQDELAEAAGISKMAVCIAEKGVAGDHVIGRLGEVLKVTPARTLLDKLDIETFARTAAA